MEDFVALGSNNQKAKARSRLAEVKPSDSLFLRCMVVVVANLERFPAEAFGIIPECDWDEIVSLRHERTAPVKGKGGIDGKGRLHPTISEKYITEVEQTNEHLTRSKQADKLVWKDIVEYKHRTGGISRPAPLTYPWPILMERVESSAAELKKLTGVAAESVGPTEKQILFKTTQILHDAPICLSVLEATSAGKVVKKFLKFCSRHKDFVAAITGGRQRIPSPIEKLERTLDRWKDIAANSGVHVNGTSAKDTSEESRDQAKAFKVAKSCKSWRELFHALEEREKHRVERQGARMRERRQKLAKTQPRIVRVKPAKPQHSRILNRPFEKKAFQSSSSSAFASGNEKFRRLRGEAAVATARQKGDTSLPKKATFANAVAFASGNKSTKRKAGTTVQMANGKRMKIPAMKQRVPGRK